MDPSKTHYLCASCGTSLDPLARYCPSCGVATPSAPVGLQETSAALLDVVRRAFNGSYEIQHILGEGGASIVYSATDLVRKCPVALKVLRPELAVSLQSARFLREIAITHSLQHRNIVPLFDSGHIDQATTGGPVLIYFTAPLIHGTTLREEIAREHMLPVDRAVEIACQIGKGLHYAHDRRVVHRDVKPGNVFLAEDGRVLLADFGIAKATADGAKADELTKTGMVIGTPTYMSPEQATGQAVDGRSDQYSLASMLYEMLTGKPPLSGSTPYATLQNIIANKPQPLRTVRPKAPVHVEEAILHALEKLPADRFSSIAEFVDALSQPDLSRISSIWGPLPQAINQHSCFAIMPFGKVPGVQEVYRDHVVPVVESFGFEIFRADDMFGHREVIRDIWNAIGSARIIIADVTDRNPNVFYELGMAHTIGKDVIIITQNTQDVPFDLTHLRHIQYEYTPRGMKIFEKVLLETVRAAL